MKFFPEISNLFLNVGGDGGVIFQVEALPENPVSMEGFISNINLGQTNSLNFNKFSIGNNVPGCLSAPFTY